MREAHLLSEGEEVLLLPFLGEGREGNDEPIEPAELTELSNQDLLGASHIQGGRKNLDGRSGQVQGQAEQGRDGARKVAHNDPGPGQT